MKMVAKRVKSRVIDHMIVYLDAALKYGFV